MNNEKKQAPRCPYCGATMHENLYAYKNGGGWCNFECPNCGAMSPKKENSESCNKAELAAYFVAKKRYEEPNRVLTRKEVEDAYSKTKEPICCEIMWCGTKKITWITDAVVPYRELPRHMQYAIEDDEEEVDEVHGFYIMERQEPKWKEYGKTWRCWMRNPTAQEMRDTPWKGESNDE